MKMKVLTSLLVLGLAGVSSTAFASNVGDGQFVLKGQAGVSTTHVDANKTTAGVFGAYEWNVGNGFAVGPEIGFEHIGKYTHDNTQVKIGVAKLGVDSQYRLSDKWYLGAHAGYAKIYTNVREFGSSFDKTPRLNGWYGGARVGYDVADNLSVYTNIDYNSTKGSNPRLSANTYTVGVQYSFGG